MKALTVNRVAAARLRANQRSYLTLAAGIFLSLFLLTTFFLCLQGIFLARMEQRYRQIGYWDLLDYDYGDAAGDTLETLGYFDRIGHVTVVGEISGVNLYLGFADDDAAGLIHYQLADGRMPQSAGEIAMERSAMLSLNLDLQLGDTVSLTVTPVDGVPENRSFTLVGILKEKTEYLTPAYPTHFSDAPITQLPALLLSSQEPAFATGRLAVHRVLSLKSWRQLQEAVSACLPVSSHLFFVNYTGQILDAESNAQAVFLMDNTLLSALLLLVLLAAALLVGCCVGIAGSMEGLLGKRAEEIGILRALGATKRQIRRIFGRESLLLALITAPAAILMGCGCTAALGYLLPEQLVFRANPWLLLPVALTGVAVILLSGGLPLRRAASKMPMSVLRDTALLRKTKGLRSRKRFRVDHLLALRRLRLSPGRQLGAVLLVMLMLLSAGTLLAVVAVGIQTFTPESAAFCVTLPYDSGTAGFFSVVPSHTLTWQDVAQLEALPGVARAEVTCLQTVTLLTRGDSSYFEESALDSEWVSQVQALLRTDRDLQASVSIAAYDLSKDDVLLSSIVDGDIDYEALNSGQEVIVVAPTWWGSRNADGSSYSYIGTEKQDAQDSLLAVNDYFSVGLSLELAQLAVPDGGTQDSDKIDLSQAVCRQISVAVGAVAENASFLFGGGLGFEIITTTQGLRNLGLYTDGIREVNLYLSGTPDAQAEQDLEQYISAIARRADDSQVFNAMEWVREQTAARNQYLLLFGSVALLFFTAAVGLIVSGVTRQLQADVRTIGMLRAVGAAERTIAGCYSTVTAASIVLALTAAAGFLLLLNATVLFLPQKTLIAMLFTMLAFATACALLCQEILRLRVREITRKSIIETIREL